MPKGLFRTASLALLLALPAGAEPSVSDSSGSPRQTLVRLGRAGDALSRLFRDGVRLQAAGRLAEAEPRFLAIVSVDSRDWEAQERLVQVLQGLGRKPERDARIEVLRRLYRAGLSWRKSYCRDVFVMGGKRVRAIEYLERDAAGRQRIEFQLSDLLEPGPPEALSILRSREVVKPVPGKAPDGEAKTIAGYELKVLGLERPRTYFVPFRKPGYADMKNVLAEIISGA